MKLTDGLRWINRAVLSQRQRNLLTILGFAIDRETCSFSTCSLYSFILVSMFLRLSFSLLSCLTSSFSAT